MTSTETKSPTQNKSSFFRQSGWMVIATFLGGIFMIVVHTVAGKGMKAREYSDFVGLLRVLIVFGIPASALQTVFAQQSAAAMDRERHEGLIATMRSILAVTFAFWVVSIVVVLGNMGPVSRALGIGNPLALVFTMALVLPSLWVPVLKGVLQGQHRFASLGSLQITDGVGRLGMMLVVVCLFQGQAALGMFAVSFGQIVTMLIGVWLTREIWKRRSLAGRFDWKTWINNALPLTLGLGTITLMSSVDLIFVKSLLPYRETALYGGAMLSGYAIIQFVSPITAVMFPRIVQSVAKSERTNTLGMTLAATILFGLAAAIGCTILPKLPLQVIYLRKPEMVAAAPLIPWFGWALLPLTVANVLIQNILARSRYQALLWLVMVPLAYAAALLLQAPLLIKMNLFDAFIRVIQTLGLFSLLLCGIAGWFSRGDSTTPVRA